MNRLNKVFLSVMLLLVSIVWLQYRRMERLTKERDRFSMNNTALLSDIKRIQSDSATMALDVKVLRLTMDEYKKFRTKDTEKIKELGMRIKHLEAAARHEVEVQAPIDAVIRDTFIVRDTIPLLRQKIEMTTPYIKLTGFIEKNRLTGDIRMPVTLNQAIWIAEQDACKYCQ